MTGIEIYAHRGAAGKAVENTWEAFRYACRIGVGIELDLQITKDGVVIVHHDDDMKRLAGDASLIAETGYEHLKELRLGKKGRKKSRQHPIPLAYEVFQWAKKEAVPLNIELKGSFRLHPEGPEIITAMLDMLDDFHVSSFDPELLKKIRALRPSIPTALIIKKRVSLDPLGDMPWIDAVHLHRRLYSQKRLNSIHSMGKGTRLYALKGRERFLKRLDARVDGIITDHPERFLNSIQREDD